MLSKKLTFSLLSLVILLTIGFIVAPSGIAHEKKDLVLADGSKITFNPDHPKPTLSVASNYDLSSADGPQVLRPGAATDEISILIDFSTPVSILEAANDRAAVDVKDDDRVDITDITISAYNKDGISVPGPIAADADASTTNESTLMRGNPDNGKNAILVIDGGAIVAVDTDGDTTATVGEAWGQIETLYIHINQGTFTNADRGLNVHEKAHAKNVASDVLIITLVNADDGDAKYFSAGPNSTYPDNADGNITTTNLAAGTPGVVSITKTLDASGFTAATAGSFTVRIILTEEPKAFTASHIVVDGGTATVGTPVMGLPIGEAELTRGNAGGSYTGTDDTVLPDPTGRDNMYHQYSVMITPAGGSEGDFTISVAQFEDLVSPISKKYVPLSKAQRLDSNLSGNALTRRNNRITDGREVLTVEVLTAADPKETAAKTAYDTRQKDILDVSSTPVFVLDKGLVIPANGFLVIAAGKTDSDPISGVQNVDAKITKKLTAAQKLYNVQYDKKLPFPANDLDAFFRNGGTLNLAYADIAAATGSGHDDAKASQDGDTTHDDYTGYVGATTNAYAAGAVLINEIMWGLDAGSVNGQYIELHNTTDTAIGIDSKEWVIAVGSAPTGFTVIDSAGNNPSSGYWAPKGQSGSTIGSVVNPLKDLISMARIPGTTDGTAAASWGASVARQNANILGQRIGTPGAANAGVTAPAPPAEPKPTPPTPVPAATAADLMISEIMVASSEGRLPQWIEITNVSVGEVSLDGWVVGIDNDSTDADVVASSLSIKLDGVTLAAGQSALVVSKTGRNSGVAVRAKGDDNVGSLDSNRIVNAHSQIKPATKVYSMLSEMSFRISLQPPLPLAGGASPRGDIVGNLGGGWELEMSETGRSSLIRREMGKTAEIMGTDAAGWVLASETSLIGAYVETYYGDNDDVGTPGYDAGGALPVELSKFGAKRDPLTGQVVVTWETQSELNNAGFYIKRAEHKTAKFVPVNPTMIPGAGTTSEKQSYTYTDTTAKPNIVYYYQIEDVSLDGNRQTLTRSHRLKGHIGAAGKLTTMWGELKERE